MGELDGKVALVTGGARGQGRAHALALAERGADAGLFDVAANIAGVPYAVDAHASKLRVGEPFERGVDVGPLAQERS